MQEESGNAWIVEFKVIQIIFSEYHDYYNIILNCAKKYIDGCSRPSW